MIELTARPSGWHAGCGRRAFLQFGGTSLLGLSLVDALPGAAGPGRKTNCIFIYLAGGPSQFETFDPKPLAPDRIRGPWDAIATRVPGLQFSELLPLLADRADCIALIRSLHHTQALHFPWPMMTGGVELRTAHGAAVTYLKRGFTGDMPAYVH